MRLRLDVSTTLNMTVKRVFHFIQSRAVIKHASARCFDALHLLNMTGNFCENIDNRLIALFLLGGRPSVARNCVIPSEVEESRGNERGDLTTAMPSF